MMRKLLLVALVCASACAPKVVTAPAVITPKFPEFARPVVPPSFASSPAAENASRGWTFLQAGDLKAAEREFAAALKTLPTFYPAETSLGYVEVARKDAKAALAHFDRALEINPPHTDLSALLGRAQVLLSLNRETEALAAFEAALAADPSQTDLARRVEVMEKTAAEISVTDMTKVSTLAEEAHTQFTLGERAALA